MWGALHQLDHKYKTKSFLFFFFVALDFLKMLIDLAFLIPTLSLLHWFIQYGKNILLKDFVLVGTGLKKETDADLSK